MSYLLTPLVVKNPLAMQEIQEMPDWSLGREDTLEKEMRPTAVFLPEKSHGQRSLAVCSPCGRKEMTEPLSIGCFHILVIVNSATMNIGVHVSFQVIVLSGYMLRSGITGSYGISIFRFWGTSSLFFIVTVPGYIPINSVRVFSFLHILSSTCYL